MKWVADSTGRFGWRPFYQPAELDNECERIVSAFMKKKRGRFGPPLTTDDLAVLVEQSVSDLDLYADLSAEGEDVEGATDFFPDRKPAVRIARELSLDASRHARLRTTLAHEFGHVRFHNFLWDGAPRRPSDDLAERLSRQRRRMAKFREKLHGHPVEEKPAAFLDIISKRSIISRREFILDAPVSDWMEWQAAYAAGAFLMPASLVRKLADSGGEMGTKELIERISGIFEVSLEAARVRLIKLGILPPDMVEQDAMASPD